MQVFNVQSKNWRTAILVYHTGSETRRNNGKNIKQTDELSPKSGLRLLSPSGQFRGKVPEVYGGKDL